MVGLCVISRCHPNEFHWYVPDDDSEEQPESGVLQRTGEEAASPEGPVVKDIALDQIEQQNDGLDDFNHPRKRRAMILLELYKRQNRIQRTQAENSSNRCPVNTDIIFEIPAEITRTDGAENSNELRDEVDPLRSYRKVHSDGLIDFLSTAWNRWDALGESGRDLTCVSFSFLLTKDDNSCSSNGKGVNSGVPPMIPSNFSLPREFSNRHHPQKSSKNVMGQIGYYCTDTCTPIFSELVEELQWDAKTVSTAVNNAIGNPDNNSSSSSSKVSRPLVYGLCTHPGHHAAKDSFGGYCYVNNAALAARLLQERLSSGVAESSQVETPKIVILDVDYHCGNGTASIFYDDPSVLVVSIHCHPDYEYPFHSGYGDETGGGTAKGCTLHLPLLPGATWEEDYETALRDRAGAAIVNFDPDAFVLSLGLDTHIHDPCAVRRAGFRLRSNNSVDADGNFVGSDYYCMGKAIGDIITKCSRKLEDEYIPTIVFQEGGYEMKSVPSAAANVLLGIESGLSNNN